MVSEQLVAVDDKKHAELVPRVYHRLSTTTIVLSIGVFFFGYLEFQPHPVMLR